MMIRPETLKQLREQYKPGTRVSLIRMNDEFTKLKPGDRGNVEFIDDCGTLFCSWDCGSCLGVVFGEDQVMLIKETSDD